LIPTTPDLRERNALIALFETPCEYSEHDTYWIKVTSSEMHFMFAGFVGIPTSGGNFITTEKLLFTGTGDVTRKV
jgi:hypothetical protein